MSSPTGSNPDMADIIWRSVAGIKATKEVIYAAEVSLTRKSPWILPRRHNKDPEDDSPYVQPFRDIDTLDGLTLRMGSLKIASSAESEAKSKPYAWANDRSRLGDDKCRIATVDMAYQVLRALHNFRRLHYVDMLDTDESDLRHRNWEKQPPTSYKFGLNELWTVVRSESYLPELTPKQKVVPMRAIQARLDAVDKRLKVIEFIAIIQSQLLHAPADQQRLLAEAILKSLVDNMDALVVISNNKKGLRDGLFEADPLSPEDRAEAVKEACECIMDYLKHTFEDILDCQETEDDYFYAWDVVRTLVLETDYKNGFCYSDSKPDCLAHQLRTSSLEDRTEVVTTAVTDQLEKEASLLSVILTFKRFEYVMWELDVLSELGCRTAKTMTGRTYIIWE